MRFKAMLLSALLVLSAGVSQAQSTQLGITGGLGVPTSDFGDVANMGYNVGVNGVYMLNPQFGIGLDLAYHGWAGSDDFNEATDAELSAFTGTTVTGSEWTWSAIQATPHIILMLPTESSMHPWFKAGGGLYNAKAKLETIDPFSGDTSESKFGFNLGVGFDYRNTAAFGIGADAAYHMISTEDDFGANISLFTVGVHWTWSLSQ